jgi:hypothetical protein
MIREVRQYTGGIAAEFNEAIKEFEKDTEPERAQWKEIGQGLGDAQRAADDVAREVQADAEGAPQGAQTNGAAAGLPAYGRAPEQTEKAEDRA